MESQNLVVISAPGRVGLGLAAALAVTVAATELELCRAVAHATLHDPEHHAGRCARAVYSLGELEGTASLAALEAVPAHLAEIYTEGSLPTTVVFVISDRTSKVQLLLARAGGVGRIGETSGDEPIQQSAVAGCAPPAR